MSMRYVSIYVDSEHGRLTTGASLEGRGVKHPVVS
jgi:hypothetical protein